MIKNPENSDFKLYYICGRNTKKEKKHKKN